MKTISTLALSLFLTLPLLAQDGIQFFEGSWEEAKAQAAKENKAIFVDCYTTWCGPCKWMDANVFPKKEVGAFMNEKFISVKLDMEKEGDGMEMRKYMEVNSFPTYLFFEADGEPIHRSGGSMPAEQFLEVAHAALDPSQQYYTLAKQYEQFVNEPEWLLNFALAKSNASLPIDDVISQYEALTSENEWQLPHNWERITQLNVPFDSEIYAYATRNQKELALMVPEENGMEIFLAYPKEMFVRKAILNAKEEGELQPYFETISEVLPDDQAPGMIAKLHANWFKRHEPEHAWDKVVLYMDQYCETPYELNGAAWDLVENEESDMAKLQKGLEWVNRSIEMKKDYNNLDTKAWLLYLMKKPSEAELAANEAIKVAKENGQDFEGTTELLQKIHGS